MIDNVIIVGAGGHARVVIDAVKSAGGRIIGALSAESGAKGARVDGVEILGADDALERHSTKEAVLANGVGGANSTAARKAVFERLAAKGWRFPPVKAASAYVCDSVRLGEGCQVLTRAIVHPGSSIGADSVINTAAVVEHDCVVGAHVFIGPAAVLCGGVRVEDGAFIGTGAIVLPGVTVAAGAHVGAGAVVRKNVPAGGKVRGGPMRVLREVAG